MSQQKITQLTPEQEALIPLYREKWRAITLSTERIDRQKAAEAVKAAYKLIGLSEPEITFSDSFHAALNILTTDNFQLHLGRRIEKKLRKPLRDQIEAQIDNQLTQELNLKLNPNYPLEGQLKVLIDTKLRFRNFIPIGYWLGVGTLLDFSLSVLNCSYDRERSETFQSIFRNCGWILPSEKICIVCERPKIFSFSSFNNGEFLHAEGTPAIQFADGYSLYSYHGVTLPEKYGKLHPHQWQAQWLLEEQNAELRRVLIQGIGYSRICQELQATEIDTWQEYTLLKIDNDVDTEPIHLLKMTCSSTKFIHALRVPPDINSAREAIRWVNWEIDPEEFSVQT